MKNLRKFAASIGVSLVALGPLLFATPAYAQTLEEAQAALAAGRQELLDATQHKLTTDQAVTEALSLLQAAQNDVVLAQSDYDNNLISDPNWTAPTQQVEHTRQVEHVETIEHVTQVPHTTTVEHVTQVSHTELVPRVETVTSTTHVPVTTVVEHTTTTVVPGGLTAKSYNRIGYNNAPPLPTSYESPIATQNVPNIEFQWGGGQVLNSGLYEDVLVAFEGNIMVPTDDWYQFYAPGDDGVKLNIAGMNLIDDWYDKGGGGTISEPVWLRAGILYPTTMYYYENGGGANVWLYYSTQSTGLAIVPPSWFGETTVTETTYEEIVTWETVVTTEEVTVYDEVVVWEDVVTYEEVTTWEEVITYEDVITFTTETWFTTEVVPGAEAPLVHDPVLLEILSNKVAVAVQLESRHAEAATAQVAAAQRVSAAEAAIPVLEQAVVDATPVEPVDPEPPIDPEPPVVPPVVNPEPPTVVEPEPVTPEPVEPVTPEPPKEPDVTTLSAEEIDPTTLDATEVEALQEVAYEALATSEPGSEEYEEALELLFVAAQADDIVVDEALAAIPLLGNAAVALTDAVNFIGNVGSDMSPKVREESKKVVISAVVAVGAAVSAATGAATAAASSPSSRKVS